MVKTWAPVKTLAPKVNKGATLGTVLGKVMEVNADMFLNASAPMEVTVLGTTTWVNKVPWKALALIVVKLLAKVNVDNLVFKKARSPMTVIEVPVTTVVSSVAPLKVSAGKVVIASGNVTWRIFAAFWNTAVPNVVSALGKITRSGVAIEPNTAT